MSMALLLWTYRSACGTRVGISALVALGWMLAACGAVFSSYGVFTGLIREPVAMRLVVAVWAFAFYVAAYLALIYVLSLVFHCPPS